MKQQALDILAVWRSDSCQKQKCCQGRFLTAAGHRVERVDTRCLLPGRRPVYHAKLYKKTNTLTQASIPSLNYCSIGTWTLFNCYLLLEDLGPDLRHSLGVK